MITSTSGFRPTNTMTGGTTIPRKFLQHANVPGGSNYIEDFQRLFDKYNKLNAGYGQPTTANVGAAKINPINLPAAYNEDAYQFKSVDPAAAIRAAINPINTQMQREFAEAGARYGAGGGLDSTGYSEFGLGKASARASENIAAMTEQALLDASKFNTQLEADMENARRTRQLQGWQSRGTWDVEGQMDTEGRRLGARGQDVDLAIANANAANRLKELGIEMNRMDPGAIMSLLGMQGDEKWKKYAALEGQYGADFNSAISIANLFAGMSASQAGVLSDYLGIPIPGMPTPGGYSSGTPGSPFSTPSGGNKGIPRKAPTRPGGIGIYG